MSIRDLGAKEDAQWEFNELTAATTCEKCMWVELYIELGKTPKTK